MDSMKSLPIHMTLSKFDLVINDITCGPCLLPIIHKFYYPSLVGVTPFLNPTYTHYSVGGYKHPAYVPHWLLPYTSTMTFKQRIMNFLVFLIERL